jgi:23S rRNA pseudouridine2605 synthase
MERIQKILAQAGIASRRKCEDLIKQGRVRMNGKLAEIGQSASEKDKITVDDRPVKFESKSYYALNKPKGYVTTMGEEHGAKTVQDLLKTKERVYPTGRLDKDAEGLLVFTNDGEWANILMHPRYEITKEYKVELDKPFEGSLNNVTIEGRRVKIDTPLVKEKNVTLTIHEGRKHIVKKIFQQQGYRVLRLLRTRVGPIKLGRLKPGEKRALTTQEISKVRQVVQNS